MFLPDLAIDPSSLDEAGGKSAVGLSEANKHSGKRKLESRKVASMLPLHDRGQEKAPGDGVDLGKRGAVASLRARLSQMYAVFRQ